MAKTVPIAIGTTAPVSNRAGQASALIFYDRLLSGASVQKAFEAARATIETLQAANASASIECRDDVDPRREVLYLNPTIVARFAESKFTPNSNGDYEIEYGLFGCSPDTFQVIFFTDDESFIDEEDDEECENEMGNEQLLASQLCRVVRGIPVRNTVWSEESEWVYGDYGVFATAVTGAGKVLAVGSTLCSALEAYYRRFGERGGKATLPAEAVEALQTLRSLDGSLGPGWKPPDASRFSKTSKGRGQPVKKKSKTKKL